MAALIVYLNEITAKVLCSTAEDIEIFLSTLLRRDSNDPSACRRLYVFTLKLVRGTVFLKTVSIARGREPESDFFDSLSL